MRLAPRLGALALACAGASAALAADPATTQSIMDSIFAPISSVLAVSFDGEEFSSPKNKAKVEKDLGLLAANVGRLEEHAKGQDRAFAFVAKSLGRDARRLEKWYQKGRYDEARFILHNMTENCIACHASLPESRKFPGSEQFLSKVDQRHLPPLERAHLQIVGRRFDDALKTFEEVFAAKDLDPAIVPVLGAFTDYLKVAIDVKSDFARPQRTIEKLLQRPTVPLHVRRQLETWLMALKEFEKSSPLNQTDLAAAKKVIDQGRAVMEFPRDRDGVVHFVTAEAMLMRYVRGRKTGKDVAEAYYLLGTTTPLTEHSFWITRSDFYLESAIRLAPEAPFAPKAYAALEESLVAGYSGSGGTRLPEDAQLLLSELKQLVEQEHGKI